MSRGAAVLAVGFGCEAERGRASGRSSTHMSFRSETCHISAFAIFATPAPKSVTNQGKDETLAAGCCSLNPSRITTVSHMAAVSITRFFCAVANSRAIASRTSHIRILLWCSALSDHTLAAYERPG